MVGFFTERAVQGDDVAFAQERIERNVLKVRRRILVICQNAHAKAAADFRKCAADAPRADDTDGLFVEVYARQTHNTEVEIARADVGAVQTAI